MTPPFASLPRNTLLALLCMALVLLPLMTLAGCKLQRYKSFRVGWKSNIRVLASSNEQELSYIAQYTPAMVQKLRDPAIKSIEEAHEAVEREGLPHGQLTHFPVSTPRRQLNAWKKEEWMRERFVLLLGGPAYSQEVSSGGIALTAPLDYSGSELTAMKATVQDVFNIPDDNVRMSHPASSTDVAEGLLWLASKLKYSPGAEALIMFCSHGNEESSYFKMPWDGEGDAEGVLYLTDGPMKEGMLKKWINAQLGVDNLSRLDPWKANRVIIIVLACRAGAFIAHQPPPS
jgi:hypothetical protein